VAYTSEEARRQLLDDLAEAVDQLGLALAALGEAYEEVDEAAANRLEQELFRPVQAAYGRGRRTHAEFAERHGIEAHAFGPGSPGLHSADPRVYLERAIDATERADHLIAQMQDSLLPVEVGDRELREGLTETRELIAAVPGRGRQLLRTIGR
jgi:acetylornithine deacetylase/succinyl-diaminopimelate desuccinylase-like protein